MHRAACIRIDKNKYAEDNAYINLTDEMIKWLSRSVRNHISEVYRISLCIFKVKNSMIITLIADETTAGLHFFIKILQKQ